MGLMTRAAGWLVLLSSTALAADGGDEAGHDKGGMPQLAVDTFGSQIFWLIVAIVILFFILKSVALPRIQSGMEERSDAIEDDLDRASEFRKKAKEAEAAYDAALIAARAKANEIAQATRDEIQKEVDAAIAKADAEIAARAAEGEQRIAAIRESALQAVEEVANETAGALVEAVAPGAAGADAIRGAVAEAMKTEAR